MAEAQPLVLVGRKFEGFDRALSTQLAANPDLPARHRLLEITDLENAVVHGDLATSGEVDVLMLITDWLPSLIAAGKLRPLDALFDGRPPEGWPDAWAPALRSLQQGDDGQTYGIAYHDGPMLVLYRTDLYGDPVEQERFAARHGYALAPPRTWTEFRDQAVWFNRPERGLYGTVQAGFPDEHNNVYDFLTHLWSRGGELVGADGRSALDTEPARQAVDYLHDLWHGVKVVDPAAAGWDSVESGVRFASGSAALMLNWCGFASLAAEPDSPTHGLIGCAPAPSGEGHGGTAVTMNAYWVLTVAAGARDPQGAMDLIRRLTTHEADVVTAESGGSATRLDSWHDARVQQLAPYYAVLEQAHANSRPVPPDPRWPQMAGILNTMMQAVVEDGAGQSALDRAHRELDALLAGSP